MNPNHEVVEAVALKEEAKKRRAPLKAQKTGEEIVLEIQGLQHEVEEFNKAVEDVDSTSVAYPIVKAAFDEKLKELKKALSKIHFS